MKSANKLLNFSSASDSSGLFFILLFPVGTAQDKHNNNQGIEINERNQ